MAPTVQTVPVASDPVAQTFQTVPKAQGECIFCDVVLSNTFYRRTVPVATTTKQSQWLQQSKQSQWPATQWSQRPQWFQRSSGPSDLVVLVAQWSQRYSCPSGPSDPVAQTLQTVPKAQGECICCDVILTNTFYPPTVPVATTTQWFQRPGPSVKVLRRAIQRLRCCIASLLLLPLHSRHFLRAFLSLWL